MKEFELDSNGYPTEQSLNYVKSWPYKNMVSLFEFIKPAFDKYGLIELEENEDNKKKWTIATGGWSGCEDVIDALRDNYIFWALYWDSSYRGGKHIFKLMGK